LGIWEKIETKNWKKDGFNPFPMEETPRIMGTGQRRSNLKISGQTNLTWKLQVMLILRTKE